MVEYLLTHWPVTVGVYVALLLCVIAFRRTRYRDVVRVVYQEAAGQSALVRLQYVRSVETHCGIGEVATADMNIMLPEAGEQLGTKDGVPVVSAVIVALTSDGVGPYVPGQTVSDTKSQW